MRLCLSGERATNSVFYGKLNAEKNERNFFIFDDTKPPNNFFLYLFRMQKKYAFTQRECAKKKKKQFKPKWNPVQINNMVPYH